uniref:Complex 1 LYR protein domain-containing protein n=1 Tax=Kalanchoe fedtschenkoi TaxID=63787 RepID=A0A7N0UL68_KALFE
MASPSRSEILSLYRSFFRTARVFPDAKVGKYIEKMTKDMFRRNRNAEDGAGAFALGQSQLVAAKRQVEVYAVNLEKLRRPSVKEE